VYAWRAPFIDVCHRRVASPCCIMIPLSSVHHAETTAFSCVSALQTSEDSV
jgi:hypothetical protein